MRFTLQVLNGEIDLATLCIGELSPPYIWDTPEPAQAAQNELNAYAREAGAAWRVRITRESESQADEMVWYGRGAWMPFRSMDTPGRLIPAADVEWRTREERTMTAELLVPWYTEQGFRDSECYRNHYLRASTEKPELVSYVTDGPADKRVRLAPGRYLQRFFGSVLVSTEIQEWAGAYLQKFAEPAVEIKFASTAADITWVYTHGADSGTIGSSCMRYPEGHWSDDRHPARIYGAGDLAVAYIDADDEVRARVLCWPEKRGYTRVYSANGVAERQLIVGLTRLGYVQGGDSDEVLNGARLKLIRVGGQYVCPYIDWHSRVSVEGKYLIIDSHGYIDCQATNGLIAGRTCENCGDIQDEENCWTNSDGQFFCSDCYHDLYTSCENCEEECVREDAILHGDKYYCEHCFEKLFDQCVHCGEYESKDDLKWFDGDSYCEDCYENEIACCDDCGDEFRADGEDYCENCREKEAQSETE